MGFVLRWDCFDELYIIGCGGFSSFIALFIYSRTSSLSIQLFCLRDYVYIITSPPLPSQSSDSKNTPLPHPVEGKKSTPPAHPHTLHKAPSGKLPSSIPSQISQS